MSLNAFDTVCAARMSVYKRLPYFMRMLFKLAPHEVKGLGTFAVDEGLRVHYDPDKVLEWGVEHCATLLAHEVQHPLRDHAGRCRAFVVHDGPRWHACRPALMRIHPLLAVSVEMFWNVVGDAEINPSLLEAGFAFPAGFDPIMPKTFGLPDGGFAEDYADELLKRAERDRRPEDADVVFSDEITLVVRGAGAGDCGSCSGNRHACEGEVDADDAPRPATATEIEIARRQVAHDTVEPTAEMARLMGQYGIGKVPGSLVGWAKAQLTPPAVPWQRVLAPLVRGAVAYARGRVDWRHGRPSRRREALKQTLGDSAPLLPTLQAPVPNVGIVVDTSGSMQAGGRRSGATTMLDDALSEVVGIVLAAGAPCWTAAVDAGVQEWVRVRVASDVDRLVKGGGGTDMRVGVAAAEARRFDVIVLVTDGLTPWPGPDEMPRHGRLVVCLTGDANVPDHIAPVVRTWA